MDDRMIIKVNNTGEIKKRKIIREKKIKQFYKKIFIQFDIVYFICR